MTESNTPEDHSGIQEELPFAIVQGEPVSELPLDLYIPPDALEVILETFEGPLDLLLYLIKRQNLDILDIPVAQITAQYMQYIDLMSNFRLELAAEYLVMAAMLAEIKSRMLLPRSEEIEDEDDPRAELVRRLQEYEQFKQAAEDLDGLPRVGRDIHTVSLDAPQFDKVLPLPDVDLRDVLFSLRDVMSRSDINANHQIEREALSVRERMSQVLEQLRANDQFTEFTCLYPVEEGRLGVVVSFIAVLELMKNHLIDLTQTESFGAIYVKAVTASVEGSVDTFSDEDFEDSYAG